MVAVAVAVAVAVVVGVAVAVAVAVVVVVGVGVGGNTMTRPEYIIHQAARFAMALLMIGAVLQIGRLALGLAAMETVLEQAERGW